MTARRPLLLALALLFPAGALAGLSAGLHTGLTLQHDGRTRSYDVYVPPGAAGGSPAPLIVDLHAFAQSPADLRAISGVLQVAEQDGLVAAWPNGGGTWNPQLGDAPFVGASRNDDQGFIRKMVTAIADQTAVDLSRVYATGWSSGGEMAQTLGCVAADVFAAITTVASTFPPGLENACDPGRPLPILILRGRTDELVPYDGGTGARFGAETYSADVTLSFWRNYAQCTGSPQTQLGGASDCKVYTQCNDGVEVALCGLRAPGGNGHNLYVNSGGLNLGRLGWDFMRRFELPEGTPQPEPFVINAGLTGAWFDPSTPGQGLLIEPIPDSKTFFAAWFTFDTAGAKVGAPEHRWFTLQGPYDGNTADVEIFESSGGVFNAGDPVSSVAVGSATLAFDGCTEATLDYAFDGGPAGSIDLLRLTPDTLCGAQTATQPAAVTAGIGKGSGFAINEGLSGAWLDPATAGQGFLFDVVPGADLFFLAWFTYESADSAKLGVPEHRWLTGQGGMSGATAQLIVNRSIGGVFDDPTPVATEPVGTATVAFSSCTEARISFDLPEDGLTGEIPLIRLAPDVHCEVLR